MRALDFLHSDEPGTTDSAKLSARDFLLAEEGGVNEVAPIEVIGTEAEVIQSAPETPGMTSNAVRKAGERGSDLIGNALQFAGRLVESGEAKITEALKGFNPGVRIDSADTLRSSGHEPDLEIGGVGLDFTTRLDPEETNAGLQEAGQAVEDVSFGHQPNFTIDRAIDEPSLKTILGAAAENGPAALADMAALIISAPAYLTSRTQEIAEARVENNFQNMHKASPELQRALLENFNNNTPIPENLQREAEQLALPGWDDYKVAGPAAAASVLVDRFALGRILPGGGKPITSMGQVPGAVARGAVTEAATEAVQEGVIEYAGESLGTAKGWDSEQAGRRAAGGAIVGGPTGGAVRAGTASYEAMRGENQTNDQASAQPDAEPPVVTDTVASEANEFDQFDEPTDEARAQLTDIQSAPEQPAQRAEDFLNEPDPGQQQVTPTIPESTDARGAPASWVIRNKETGDIVAETFERKTVEALNTEKYEAVPIAEHLAGLNNNPADSSGTAEAQPDLSPKSIGDTKRGRKTRNDKNSGVPQLDGNAAPVRNQKSVPQRDGVPAVEQELSGVSEGYGAAPVPGSDTGPDQSEGELRAGQRSLGDNENPAKQSDQQQANRVPGPETNGQPVGRKDWYTENPPKQASGGGNELGRRDNGQIRQKGEAVSPSRTDEINRSDRKGDRVLGNKGVEEPQSRDQGGRPETQAQEVPIQREGKGVVGDSATERPDTRVSARTDLSTGEIPSASIDEYITTETNTAPSEAQAKQGNYKKAKVKLSGLDIAIENPKGSTRSGTDADGNKWESSMAHHYGYIKRTEGADGDHVDVFIGPDPESDRVFVIDQPNADGTFDEHKVMIGFRNQAAARKGYRDNYEAGWKAGPTTRLSMDEFKAWLKDGDTTRPLQPNKVKPKKVAAPSGKNVATQEQTKESAYSRDNSRNWAALPAEKAQRIADGLMQGWKDRPQVIIQDHLEDFPSDLQAQIIEDKAEDDMNAILWSGKVYIRASRIPNRYALERIILHEVIGHYGLRKLLGAELKPILNQVWLAAGGKSKAKAIIDAYFPDGSFDVNNVNHRHTVAEELIAHIAETKQHQKLWARIVTAIKNGLRRLGFQLKLGASDILDLLRGAQQVVEQGGYSRSTDSGAVGGLATAGQYSKETRPQPQVRPLQSRWEGAESAPQPESSTETEMEVNAPDARYSRAGRSGSDRSAWPSDFPRVPFAAPLQTASKHPKYEAAKGGDVEAARELVSDVVTDDVTQAIEDMLDGKKPTVVAVFAEEATGRNMIPVAYAAHLAKELGLTTGRSVVQSVRAHRTGTGADHRLANHAVFDGEITAGTEYLIVDDTMTMGGTLANLRGHIEANGGVVVGATTLTGFGDSGQLALTDKMRNAVWAKHGKPLDDYLQQEFGFGIDSLTQGEAGHFRKAVSLDAIRDRIAAARVGQRDGSADESVDSSSPRYRRGDLESQPETRLSRFFDGIATQPVDRMFRALFDVAGLVDAHGRLKPGVAITDGAKRTLTEWRPNPQGKFTWFDNVLETARHGLLDRYKLSDEYKQTWRQAEAYSRSLDMDALEILRTLEERGVNGTEAAVLQKILTGEPVPNHHLNAVAAPILRAIDDLGQAAVEYGIITSEQFERNRGEYLHRSYLRHESSFTGLGKWIHSQQRKQNRKIKGDTSKGRGIEIKVPTERLLKDIDPEWLGIEKAGDRPDREIVKGKKIKVLEEALSGESEQGSASRARRIVYWPADQRIPPMYSGFRERGTYEVRGVRSKNLVLWRDYTKLERKHMGEILDARYNIAKTFQLLSKDLAMGKFFQDVSLNPEWYQQDKPEDGVVVTPGEARTLHALSKTDWVQVPETVVSQSAGTKQWGALAGGYVRAEIWRDLNELDKMHNPGMWRKVLTQWKLNKTARSPVVHMNNVMSNLVLMDLADVRVADLYKGIQSYRKRDEHWRAAQEYGAFEGTFINEEIQRQVLDPILDELTKQSMATDTSAEGAVNSLSRMAYTIWAKLKKADRGMANFYQIEDELFRMATYMRRLDLGDAPIDAARMAREQFLDYDIRAPWVNAARRSVLPFIAYTYRAIPVVAQSVIHRPWKLAKYATIAYLANAMAYMLAPGDEDEERRTMRDDQQGYTWFGTPRMLRMPWHDEHGNPVFMDIRRWIPAGDVFDMNQGNSALAVPAPIQFGGPMMLAFEFALNKQAFTGEEIVNRDTDTTGEAVTKTADWLYKSWMPSAGYIPGSYYWEKFWNASDGARDIIGRPYSVPQALLSSIGIKVQPHDVRLGYEFRSRDLAAQARMIQADVRRAQSDLDRGIIKRHEFNKIAGRARAKLERLIEEQKKLEGRG